MRNFSFEKIESQNKKIVDKLNENKNLLNLSRLSVGKGI